MSNPTFVPSYVVDFYIIQLRCPWTHLVIDWHEHGNAYVFSNFSYIDQPSLSLSLIVTRCTLLIAIHESAIPPIAQVLHRGRLIFDARIVFDLRVSFLFFTYIWIKFLADLLKIIFPVRTLVRMNVLTLELVQSLLEMLLSHRSGVEVNAGRYCDDLMKTFFDVQSVI